MPTANEALLDSLLRHQIDLLRYTGFLRNEMWKLLDAGEIELAEAIRAHLRRGTGLTTPAEVYRLERLIATIRKIRSKTWDTANEFMAKQAMELAIQEAKTIAGLFILNSPVVLETVAVGREILKDIVESRPFHGGLLSEWATTMRLNDLKKIEAVIRVGMIAAHPVETMVKAVIGSRALDGSDGVTEYARRQVTAIVRTAVMHITSDARAAFYEKNRDVVSVEKYVATLDGATTPICRSLDGKRFPIGEGERPPMHVGCRSIRIPAFDSEEIGNRPFKASTEKILLKEFTSRNKLPVSSRDGLPRGFKTKFDAFAQKRVREMTGQVPVTVSYQKWLSEQTSEFQDEVLGIDKAKLFRAGLTLNKYVTEAGTEMTLAQLATKYAKVFVKAGLDPAKY